MYRFWMAFFLVWMSVPAGALAYAGLREWPGTASVLLLTSAPFLIGLGVYEAMDVWRAEKRHREFERRMAEIRRGY